MASPRLSDEVLTSIANEEGADPASLIGAYAGRTPFQATDDVFRFVSPDFNPNDPASVARAIARVQKTSSVGPASPSSSSASSTASPSIDFDPGRAVQDFLKSMDTYNTVTKPDLVRDYKTALTANIDAITAVGEANANLAITKAAQETKMAQEANSLLSKMQINMDDPEGLQAQIGVRMASGKVASDSLYQEIMRAQQINMFQDPMGYIGAQINLPSMVAQFNAISGQMKKDASDSQMLTSTMSNFNTVNQAKKGMDASAVAQASARLYRETATAESAKVRLNSQEFMWKSAKEDLSLLSDRVTVLNHLAVLNLNSEFKEDKIKALQLKEENDKLTLDGFNIAAKLLGQNPIPSLTAFKLLPEPLKAALGQVAQNGEVGMKTPLGTLEQIRAAGNMTKMPDATITLAKLTAAAVGKARSDISKDPTKSTLRGEDEKAAINKAAAAPFEAWQADTSSVPSSTMPNIYHAGPAAEMLKTPSIASSQLGVLLSNTLKAQPHYPLDDDKSIIALTVAEVTKPGSTYKAEQAAKDLVNYYEEAAKKTNSTYNFEAFGLPKQHVYGVKPRMGPTTDMLDYQAVRKLLLYRSIGERANSVYPYNVSPVPGLPLSF